jgi:hypothetical protein
VHFILISTCRNWYAQLCTLLIGQQDVATRFMPGVLLLRRAGIHAAHNCCCWLLAAGCPAGDASWQLLDVEPEVFNGSNGPGSALRYPEEARGLLKARGRTGYIQDPAVLAAYRKVRR